MLLQQEEGEGRHKREKGRGSVTEIEADLKCATLPVIKLTCSSLNLTCSPSFSKLFSALAFFLQLS